MARSSLASPSERPIGSGGDLVANTSQTGYQEVATDPVYAGQVVAMTYPLIGNYGRLVEDDQSERPWLRALIVAHATAPCVGRASRSSTCCERPVCLPSPASTPAPLRATCARRARSAAYVSGPGETDGAAAVRAARGLSPGRTGLR
jgi:carbamoyl-phosphate synthase small subunit